MKNLYKKIAKYYDKLYSWKDYETESEITRDLIKEYKSSPGKQMLDVCCGTGNHIKYLRKYFNITGVDVSPDMLQIAQKKYPDIKFICDDMRTFKLKKRFDVIICMFSSIGHLKTYSNIEKAIRNFAVHLKPGGVLLIEPFVNPECFISNNLDASFVNEQGLKVARINVGRRKGNIALYDFHYLIGEKGKITYFVDKMQLGMFESSKVLKIMENAGLKSVFLKKRKEYRGRYIGVKKKEL